MADASAEGASFESLSEFARKTVVRRSVQVNTDSAKSTRMGRAARELQRAAASMTADAASGVCRPDVRKDIEHLASVTVRNKKQGLMEPAVAKAAAVCNEVNAKVVFKVPLVPTPFVSAATREAQAATFVGGEDDLQANMSKSQQSLEKDIVRIADVLAASVGTSADRLCGTCKDITGDLEQQRSDIRGCIDTDILKIEPIDHAIGETNAVIVTMERERDEGVSLRNGKIAAGDIEREAIKAEVAGIDAELLRLQKRRRERVERDLVLVGERSVTVGEVKALQENKGAGILRVKAVRDSLVKEKVHVMERIEAQRAMCKSLASIARIISKFPTTVNDGLSATRRKCVEEVTRMFVTLQVERRCYALRCKAEAAELQGFFSAAECAEDVAQLEAMAKELDDAFAATQLFFDTRLRESVAKCVGRAAATLTHMLEEAIQNVCGGIGELFMDSKRSSQDTDAIVVQQAQSKVLVCVKLWFSGDVAAVADVEFPMDNDALGATDEHDDFAAAGGADDDAGAADDDAGAAATDVGGADRSLLDRLRGIGTTFFGGSADAPAGGSPPA